MPGPDPGLQLDSCNTVSIDSKPTAAEYTVAPLHPQLATNHMQGLTSTTAYVLKPYLGCTEYMLHVHMYNMLHTNVKAHQHCYQSWLGQDISDCHRLAPTKGLQQGPQGHVARATPSEPNPANHPGLSSPMRLADGPDGLRGCASLLHCAAECQ